MQLVSIEFSALGYILTALLLLGPLLLYWNSAIRHHSLYNAVLLTALATMLVGGLFYIQHWSGSRLVLLTAGGLLLGSYVLWFRRKPAPARLDYLKLLWVVALACWSIVLGSGMRWLLPYNSALLTVSFWALLLDFVYQTYVRRPRAAR